jgi:hypothetical protein
VFVITWKQCHSVWWDRYDPGVTWQSTVALTHFRRGQPYVDTAVATKLPGNSINLTSYLCTPQIRILCVLPEPFDTNAGKASWNRPPQGRTIAQAFSRWRGGPSSRLGQSMRCKQVAHSASVSPVSICHGKFSVSRQTDRQTKSIDPLHNSSVWAEMCYFSIQFSFVPTKSSLHSAWNENTCLFLLGQSCRCLL